MDVVELLDTLFDRDDGGSRGQHDLLLHADDAFDQHIPLGIGLLRVHNRHVWTHGGHRRQFLPGERALHRAVVRILIGQLAAMAAEHREREVAGPRFIRIRESRVRILFQRQRRGPVMFDGVTQPVQRPHSGIAAPREHQA